MINNPKCPACGHDKVLWRDVKDRLYELPKDTDCRMILLSISGKSESFSLQERIFHCSILDACVKCGCMYVITCAEGVEDAEKLSEEWNNRNAP